VANRQRALAGLGVNASVSAGFWKNRQILLTGHTGFKGAWLAAWLGELGARVYGFALPPDTEPNLFRLLRTPPSMASQFGDIRDPRAVRHAVQHAAPQVVIHMAAQALVRRSYREPVATFETNLLGTVHLLEALRDASDLAVVLVITSDKVYENPGTGTPLSESATLGGADPYSASKAAAEIATASYARSFFAARGVAVATARAGNVIGGGDWSEDRIVADIWRALHDGAPLELRYPDATRPWQHVLEPLAGYLRYAEALGTAAASLPRALNFGPDAAEVLTVTDVVERFQAAYGTAPGWRQSPGEHPREAPKLAVDACLARHSLDWRPRLDASTAVAWTAEWYRAFDGGTEATELTLQQIRRYQEVP
jgi:CDP-glucose 4,6-dehydratase